METSSEGQLGQQLEALQKLRVKQARRCATAFGIVSIVALLSFVYGLVQYNAGREISERAETERREAVISRDEALRQVAEAEVAMKKLEQLTIELEICRASRK